MQHTFIEKKKKLQKPVLEVISLIQIKVYAKIFDQMSYLGSLPSSPEIRQGFPLSPFNLAWYQRSKPMQ